MPCCHSESGKRETGNLSTLSTIWGKGLFKVSRVIEKKNLVSFLEKVIEVFIAFCKAMTPPVINQMGSVLSGQ